MHFRGIRGGAPVELLSDQFCRAEVLLDELRPEAAEKKAFEVFALVDAHLELRILEDANHLLQLLLDLVSILHFCHCFEGHLDGFDFDPMLAIDVQLIEALAYAVLQVDVQNLLHGRFDA